MLEKLTAEVRVLAFDAGEVVPPLHDLLIKGV
jgi:hypothetical protein